MFWTKPVVWRRKANGKAAVSGCSCRSVGRLFVRGESCVAQPVGAKSVGPEKAKPHDNDADSADASLIDQSLPGAPPLAAEARAPMSSPASWRGRQISRTRLTTLWSIVVKLAGDGADAEAAFLHIVLAVTDDHARLRGFDGRSA